MVTIINLEKAINENGKEFYSLILHGDVEIAVSKSSGLPYATARRARLVTTFDEAMCKSLIGKSLAGTVEKVQCKPYDWAVPETGEIIRLNHRYQYVPPSKESIAAKEEEAFHMDDVQEELEEVPAF